MTDKKILYFLLIILAIVVVIVSIMLIRVNNSAAFMEEQLKQEKQVALDSAAHYKSLFVENFKLGLKKDSIADSLSLVVKDLSDLTTIRKRHEGELTLIRTATVNNIDSILAIQISEDVNN